MKCSLIVVLTLTLAIYSYSPVKKNSKWFDHPRVEQWNSRTEISISNPHETVLENVPVNISIDKLGIDGDDFEPGNFYVYSHEEESTPLFQVDVLETSQVNDIVFLTTVEHGQEKIYYIYYAENGQAWPKQERFTQATNMPGWESELFGYRSYGPFLIDLFARDHGHKNLMLHRFYNGQNEQIYNYHAASNYGLDILHMDSTAGLAGVGLHKDGKTVLANASNSFESEVIVSGPVRSIVQMQMKGWESEHGEISITRQATIYAHHYETQIEDQVMGVNNNALYAVGIRKVEGANTDFNKKQGLFLQWQNQGDDIGEAGIGIYLQPEDSKRIAENKGNNFILTRPPDNKPLRFWVFGAWERGEDISNLSDFKVRAKNIKQLQRPLDVNIMDTQYPSAKK